MNAIDYEKYSNMSQKQLSNALINAEKKEQKIRLEFKSKMQNTRELVKFLKAKIKKSKNKPKYEFIPYEKTDIYRIAKEYEATLSDEEKAKLKAEVEAEVNRDYGDEL